MVENILHRRFEMIASAGKCECGSTKITLVLPEPLDKYNPRKCDCDFCLSRNIAYLSHPKGKLIIDSNNALKVLKQGSNQAKFITCVHCESVIAACWQSSRSILGALNATLLLQYSGQF